MFRRTRIEQGSGNWNSNRARSKSPNYRSRQRRLRFEPLETRRLLAITVNTLTDELDGSIVDGDISLRDALLAATPFETINFDASLTSGGPATLNLKLGELRITKSVIINGPGADLLTISASGNDLTPFQQDGKGSRVFNINDGSAFTNIDVRIDGLALTGGDVSLDGGAIRNFETLTAVGLRVTGNHAGQDGAGEAMITENIGVEREPGRLHVLHFDRARDPDTGVVHQHVEPASGHPLRIGDGARNHVVVGYVQFEHGDVELLVDRQLAQLFGLRTG